ncbi:MacB family efflux pump subunit [Aeromonas veronii]
MNKPLIQLKGVERYYQDGEQNITVLHKLDLTIQRGEMIAIMGASGSGKSTLMNLLGCLDRPSSGQYFFRGQDTGTLDALALAHLRCHHFGFIFQRYHLLPHLNAAANVEIPAIYAGTERQTRQTRVQHLLTRLRLDKYSHHLPEQLSGGQQQRVSIARALVNGGEVILADEPTGALDSKNGKEVMKTLKELHTQGHTIILITHDMDVANYAERIITLKDGHIQEDSNANKQPYQPPVPLPAINLTGANLDWDRYREVAKIAIHAMLANRMRTFLTMLGIIIGIAAVVSVVALGRGASTKVIEQINAMGTNTIEMFPGNGWGDENTASIQTLNEGDLGVLLEQPYLTGASPEIASSMQLRYNNKTSTGIVTGVGNHFFKVKGVTLMRGRLLELQDIKQRSAVAVVDQKSISSLVGNEDPLGKVLLVGTLPVRIVGIVDLETNIVASNQSVNLWLPYSAVMSRLVSQRHFTQLSMGIKDGVQPEVAEQAVIDLISKRHGMKDFFTYTSDSIIKSVEKTTTTMTLMVSGIAVISLIVGGVGVMNIMLVSVVERTKEIGIRMAIGARESDILQQFLLEAVILSLLGGGLGVGLSICISIAFSLLVDTIEMQVSILSILIAFGCSSLIGIMFGYLPAHNAARLDPAIALARE